MTDVYEAVARPSSDHLGHRLYDVYLMVDGRPHGKPVIKTVGHAEALRLATALTEWQPKVERRNADASGLRTENLQDQHPG